LDRLGLTKAIEGIVRSVSAASGVRFSSELDNIDNVFEEELRINFYRVVQECLNNVVKHSGALLLSTMDADLRRVMAPGPRR
jgi:signal transduction histidine kinase